ncbi:TetR/AcrR family transcriptional regulator [Cellulosimicrobium cellulans]|uniref:TetR family transcriptional regulator n=1 Tax=Cellulosimicrobium cellulans TaxID=1710 RepID=A0A4Y4DYW2_CELCE|nr:TetR family transcriptional regulator [Cellulosimicrobium cellulans]GED08600.1 TetR family transcriptional regulator [Cellulosimicrobium cellulans]
MSGRRGRRPGRSDTRADILSAARDAFAEHGYDRATVRAIATRAGVDAAMVHHWFGTKERLFQAAVDVPFDPRELLLDGAPDGEARLGEHVVRTLLRAWDSPRGRVALALLRSATSSERAARMLRELVLAWVVRPTVARSEPDPHRAAWRSALMASQLAGLVVARYVLRVEPLAGAPAETVVGAVGPTIQGYLTGPLPGAVTEDSRTGGNVENSTARYVAP